MDTLFVKISSSKLSVLGGSACSIAFSVGVGDLANGCLMAIAGTLTSYVTSRVLKRITEGKRKTP